MSNRAVTRARNPGKDPRTEEALRECIALMTSGQWVTGASTTALATKYGVCVDTVQKWGAEAQSDRFQADPWESVLAEWAARSLDHWVPSTSLSTTLGIEPQRVDRTIEMRIAICMKRLGWARERATHNRVRQWGWRRPTPKIEAEVGQKVGQPIAEQSRQAALPTPPALPSPKGEGGDDRNRGGVTYPPARENSLEVLGGGWGVGQVGRSGPKHAESQAETPPYPAALPPEPMREPGDDSDIIDGDGDEGGER